MVLAFGVKEFCGMGGMGNFIKKGGGSVGISRFV